MEYTILYSSAGVTQTLVAVPESNLIGGPQWRFLENNDFEVTQVARLQNPNPTPEFQTIGVYSVALKTQQGVQRFQEVQGGVALPLPLISGAISMITHPVSTTQMIHATLPVGGVDKQPLLIAVRDNAGSTGYHWQQVPAKEAGLQTASHFFPPESQAVGAPGIRVFEYTADESGHYTVQLRLMPPGGKQAASTIAVSIQAINA